MGLWKQGGGVVTITYHNEGGGSICQNNAESSIWSLCAHSIENTNQTVMKDRVARLEVAYQLYLMVVVVFHSLGDPCKRALYVGKKLKTWMKWMKSYQFSEADESVQVHTCNKTRSTMSPRIPSVGFLVTFRERSRGKVMFLHVSMILFTWGGSVHPPRQTPPWQTPPLSRQPPADTP